MNIEKYNVCYKPCAQRAHTHLLMYNFCWIIFPKFWQFISNKYFYFKNVHSPTLRRKGSQKPFNWHRFILIVGMIYPNVHIHYVCLRRVRVCANLGLNLHVHYVQIRPSNIQCDQISEYSPHSDPPHVCVVSPSILGQWECYKRIGRLSTNCQSCKKCKCILFHLSASLPS